MKFPKKPASRRGGNIKAEPAYDPFPKSGLVKQYEPFIRKWVGEYCKSFPQQRYDDVLIQVVGLAALAAQRFSPTLGYDFSTLLRHYFKKVYAKPPGMKGWSHTAPRDWSWAGEDPERSPQPIFPPGANGTRVAFDHWNLDGGADKRRGAIVAIRLAGNSESYARGFSKRASAALTVLGSDGKLGHLKGAFAHLERRQREEEAEIEDQAQGVYDPTFLEARPVALHREHYEAKTPRHSSLFPKPPQDGPWKWTETWQNHLGTILYAKPSKHKIRSRGLSGEEIDAGECRFDLARTALQPLLSPDEHAVLAWIGDQMFGEGGVSAEQLAGQIGRTKRTIYKIRERLILKLKNELKNNFQK